MFNFKFTVNFFQLKYILKKKKKKVRKVTFLDSLKILNFSVETIAKTFHLEISKLELDYNKPREIGHILTDFEKEYIKNDVLIVAEALKILFDENLTKMTQASNAMYDYKNIVKQNKFEHYFPKLDLEVDEYIRESYRRWIYVFKSDFFFFLSQKRYNT